MFLCLSSSFFPLFPVCFSLGMWRVSYFSDYITHHEKHILTPNREKNPCSRNAGMLFLQLCLGPSRSLPSVHIEIHRCNQCDGIEGLRRFTFPKIFAFKIQFKAWNRLSRIKRLVKNPVFSEIRFDNTYCLSESIRNSKTDQNTFFIFSQMGDFAKTKENTTFSLSCSFYIFQDLARRTEYDIIFLGWWFSWPSSISYAASATVPYSIFIYFLNASLTWNFSNYFSSLVIPK